MNCKCLLSNINPSHDNLVGSLVLVAEVVAVADYPGFVRIVLTLSDTPDGAGSSRTNRLLGSQASEDEVNMTS
ncbi:hypothetical protein KY290_034014 [Solanum tuberosum]|uniref:Uncharacterized protein n=1 Tax=Solanum tuberosum TaxID=4113 RepID=A0ABQ7U3Q8_SOLTU|nr:hypothetical protein KY289_033395 [Solanum tuberosum]KAH0648033.1 hypothetical protein KY285_033281 [Solanum tuberosum]KAH0740971.1 hypothetical protein KY290_034014 [Solanum tuberosum]